MEINEIKEMISSMFEETKQLIMSGELEFKDGILYWSGTNIRYDSEFETHPYNILTSQYVD